MGNLFELLKKYAILLFDLFLILWSIWRIIKDKRQGKPIVKRVVVVGSISFLVIIIMSLIILS